MFEWNKKEAPIKALAGMGGGVGRGLIGGAEATGGTIVYYGGKTLHMFKSSDTFSSNGSKTCEYVIVAGGAAGSSSGGGGTAGGGGGAGGYLSGTGLVLDGDFRVEVGNGGTCPAGGSGTPGTPSYIGPGPNWNGNSVDGSRGTHAIGGGRGGDYQPNTAAENGGSGGGGDYNSIPAGYGFNPTTPAPILSDPRYVPGDTQGMPGGDGAQGTGQIGGGGGGAGGAGVGGSSGFTGGNGVRIPTTWHTPTINIGAPGPNGLWYCCGGGGGARYSPGSFGSGGYGGGGPGNSGGDGTAGTTNSGGGGGGISRADGNSGGSGGTGFVLIGYPT